MKKGTGGKNIENLSAQELAKIFNTTVEQYGKIVQQREKEFKEKYKKEIDLQQNNPKLFQERLAKEMKESESQQQKNNPQQSKKDKEKIEKLQQDVNNKQQMVQDFLNVGNQLIGEDEMKIKLQNELEKSLTDQEKEWAKKDFGLNFNSQQNQDDISKHQQTEHINQGADLVQKMQNFMSSGKIENKEDYKKFKEEFTNYTTNLGLSDDNLQELTSNNQNVKNDDAESQELIDDLNILQIGLQNIKKEVENPNQGQNIQQMNVKNTVQQQQFQNPVNQKESGKKEDNNKGRGRGNGENFGGLKKGFFK